MGIYKDHLREVSKNDYFMYMLLSIFIIYFFTKAVNTTVGHLLAFIVIAISIFLLVDMQGEESIDFYHSIDAKLTKLSDNTDDYYYFYLDPDLIQLFLEIKNDFYEFNPDAYDNALKSANIVLMCRKAIETKMCPQAIIPMLSDNYTKTLMVSESPKKCEEIIQNGYATFELAKKQSRLCVNFLHSIILSLHVDPTIQLKHQDIIKRSRLLLKRNLDIIRSIYNKNTDLTHPQITHYDSFIPYDEHVEEDKINTNFTDSSFNFF